MESTGRPLLLSGGRIHTMIAGDDASHDAIGLAAGRVVAVGARDDVRSAVGDDAYEIGLDGATVLPGLVDTHPHLLHFGAIKEPLVDISDAESHTDILDRIRARAQETARGEWIMTTPVGEAHYFIRRSWRDLAEGALPDRHVLDRATSDHPVWIQAWAPSTPNVTAFNSAGLAAIGVDRTTPDQMGQVWIEKDEQGEPTGILRGSVNNYYNDGSPWWDSVLERIPLLTPEGVVNGTLRAMGEYNARGVTTVFEGHMMDFPHIEVYQALRDRDALTVRVLATPESELYNFPGYSTLSHDEFRARLTKALANADTSGEKLKIDGVTIAVGGPCWPGMLRAYEPYRSPYGEMINRGPWVDPSKSRLVKEFCAQNRLRLNICSGADVEHDEHLHQLEQVVRDTDFRDQHWILQHGIHLTETHVRRFAELGFDMTTSMSFSWGKGDLYRERIGEHYLRDLVPLRRMLDAGVTVGCGSDWGPRNIFEHMALAMTHEFAGSGRTNGGPAQVVTRQEAVAMWTRDAARVLRWPGIGTLEPGSHADLAVLDRSPLGCALSDLPGTEILATYLGGRPVYDGGRLGTLAEAADAPTAEAAR